VLTSSGDHQAALTENFGHAMAGLGAQKGVLFQIKQVNPIDIEILCAGGLNPEEERACRSLNSCPGISPTLIRRTIEQGQPTLIADSNDMGNANSTGSFRLKPFSILCAPILDSLTGSAVALLYFQNDAKTPFTPEDLVWLTAYAAALGQAITLHLSVQQRIKAVEAEWQKAQDAPEIIGDSEAARRLETRLHKLLPSTTRPDAPPILVCGESGTGKDLVARFLHHYSPTRSRGPYKTFNCAALRGDLAESRLFGHTKGAFTGAIADMHGLFRTADKGVLFLDEIGEMPAEVQGLLLRVLETRTVQPVGDGRETTVDVQLVLATNRDLRQEVEAKRFREDLYYRVSSLRIDLVPLRDPSRLADIRALLNFYLGRHERRLKKKTQGMTPAAFRALLAYSWPGNVRELNNVCTALVTDAAPGEWIDVSDIKALRPEVLSGPKNRHPEVFLEDENLTYGEAILAFRKKLLLDRLAKHGGSVAAAKSLGVPESTFYRYLSDARKDQ
jgi:two-component system response regulator HydG